MCVCTDMRVKERDIGATALLCCVCVYTHAREVTNVNRRLKLFYQSVLVIGQRE